MMLGYRAPRSRPRVAETKGRPHAEAEDRKGMAGWLLSKAVLPAAHFLRTRVLAETPPHLLSTRTASAVRGGLRAHARHTCGSSDYSNFAPVSPMNPRLPVLRGHPDVPENPNDMILCKIKDSY